MFNFLFVINSVFKHRYCIDDVTVSVLASSEVDRGFEPQSTQTKHYEIGICCFFAKHAAFSRKSKYWLARNHDNVSDWSNMPFQDDDMD